MIRRVHRAYIFSLVVIGLTIAVWVAIYGADYYMTPIPDRHGHDLHETLSPTGFWGHGMGFIGAFLMTVGVLMYSLRKRWKRLANVGLIKHVLEMHIFLCLLGPVLVVYHTAFKFGGLVGISFWCMVIVVLSGALGRYLYMQIPKTITGREVSPFELERQIGHLDHCLRKEISDDLVERVNALTPDVLASADMSAVVALSKLIVHNARQGRTIRAGIHRMVSQNGSMHPDVVARMVERAHLKQQLVNLTLTQRLFRAWHMFHLPFAIVMFVIMVAHIVTAFLFGYGWVFTSG